MLLLATSPLRHFAQLRRQLGQIRRTQPPQRTPLEKRRVRLTAHYEDNRRGVSKPLSTAITRQVEICRAAVEEPKGKDSSFLNRIVKRVLFWFCSAALFLGLFIAALPSLVSTSLGLGVATMGVNMLMPGLLEVQKVSTGWRRPVLIEGIVVKDGMKKLVPVVQIEKVSTSKTLLDIVKGESYEVFILGPTVNAFPDEMGSIPAVRFAQKTGILVKAEKQENVPFSATSSENQSKKRAVVRTKHFEEWMANTAKKARKEPKPLSRSFVQDHINMTAELRSKGTSVLVNDGKVLVTREVRSLVGDYMHWIVAHGTEDVCTISEDLDLKTDWIGSYEDMVGEEQSASADPILLNIDSPNISTDMRGWKVQRTVELERPGKAHVTVTPAFARECLALLNPLLINTVAMKSEPKVAVELSTKSMSLPSSVIDFRIHPIRITAESTPIWDSLLNLLRVRERGLVPGQPLQVWTSAIDCSLIDNETVRCNRCDMLLGPPNKGVHVVVWGDSYLDSEQVKMWLGIPADTLQRIGYKNLKPDYVLPIPLRGTIAAPQVDWNGASDEIGKLAFTQLVGDVPVEEAEGFEGYWKTKLLTAAKKSALQNKKSDSGASVPSQKNPLPWDENSSGHQ